MALLAPQVQDWHPPRDHTMDLPSQNSSIPRQRSSPANDHSPSSSPKVPTPPQEPTPPPQQQAQQPYPYPVQQQPQGGWTPSIAAQPFYPSFYQNPNQQQAYNLHGHPPHTTPGQIPQQNPYFDPAANAQLAQWAYQQMMFNAQHQAHQMQHIPRNGPNATPDYFAQNPLAGFNAFPSGTPPPPPPNNHAQSFSAGGQQRGGSGDQQQYSGFHPYRRPNRQASTNSQDSDWRGVPFQPPYGRTDAASSSTSVNSQSSYTGGGPRPRTISNQTSSSNGHSTGGTKHKPTASSSSTRSRLGAPAPVDARTRSGSNSSSNGQVSQKPHLHHRNTSSSSSSSSSNTAAPRPSMSSVTSTVTSASTSSSPSLGVLPKARPVRRSPLSQGNFTATEKRMSRDDSDIAAMMESSPNASALRGGGLKGRLRRALSLNASQTLGEEKHVEAAEEDDDDDDASIKATASGRILPSSSGSKPPVSKPLPGTTDDTESTATVQTKKKSRAASLFNSRLNASTDNISLSSTVSSASVMIRKLGSMGNLARRNSLAGITSLFKDKKDKNKDGDEGGSKKKKKGGKGEAAEASISHATAEIDRSSDWNVGGEMSGLSPAAKLARQHTLKSNAEAAARAKAQQESAASASVQPGASVVVNGTTAVPDTWEKNTKTGAGRSPARSGSGGVARVNEDGTRVLVEDDDSGSEDGSGDGTYDGQHQASIADGWDDDEDWGDGAEDQDTTIRVSMERTNLGGESEDTETWATNVRRSMERVRVPTKGILKHAASYDQQSYLAHHANPTFNRARANSDNSHPTHNVELGPLARIPSPDPDHIDGLSRHPSHSSQHAPAKPSASFLPTLPFESSGGFGTDSPKNLDSGRSSPNPPEKAIFNHPSFNSSAPTLSTMVSSNPLTLTHRSATAPAKRLVFANNLSVYDTFSSSVYDRRSEPATWSRLTPALAQRIKEELNSYKMEEMEVHAASRIHTQFFV